MSGEDYFLKMAEIHAATRALARLLPVVGVVLPMVPELGQVPPNAGSLQRMLRDGVPDLARSGRRRLRPQRRRRRTPVPACW